MRIRRQSWDVGLTNNLQFEEIRGNEKRRNTVQTKSRRDEGERGASEETTSRQVNRPDCPLARKRGTHSAEARRPGRGPEEGETQGSKEDTGGHGTAGMKVKVWWGE